MGSKFYFGFYLCASLSLLLITNSSGGDGISFGKERVTVNIINTLLGGKQLGIHCASKDTDLGIHIVAPGLQYQFGFKPSIFGNTLFHCAFGWLDQAVQVNHSCTVFSEKVHYDDKQKCPNHVCTWRVTESGICATNIISCTQWSPNCIA